MIQELKGRNGKEVGSEDYFKAMNDKEFIGTLMKSNKKRWDYYYVLGGSSTKLKDCLNGQTGSQIKTSLNNIARTIKSDLEAGTEGKNFIILKNRKNIKDAIQHLSKCGLRGLSSLDSKIVKLTFLEGFDGRPIIIPAKWING